MVVNGRLDAVLAQQVQQRIWRAVGQVFRIVRRSAGELVVRVKAGDLIDAGPLELIEHAVDLIEKIVVFDKVGKYPRHRDQRGLDLGRLAVVELLQFELQFGEQIKLVDRKSTRL